MTDAAPPQTRIVVGVTGHRNVGDDPGLRARVRFALLLLSESKRDADGRPAALTVVSAIAEGADRLVAREALRFDGGALEVVLPFAEADYLEDFETDASKAEFGELLARSSAAPRVVGSSDNRDEGYEKAGRAITDACDVLLAIWDGEGSRGRGGTAEIVAYARDQGRRLLWIESQAPFLIHDDAGSDETADYNAYLRDKLDPEVIEKATADQRGWWTPRNADDANLLDLDAMMGWILPDFVRADQLATRYQQWHYRVGFLMFTLPVVAVLTVTIQSFFAPRHPELMLIEVAALLGLLILLGVSRKAQLHSRWISYRFLAERLRSSYFLAIVGSTDQRRERHAVTYLDDPSDQWIRLMIAEAYGRRPSVPTTDEYMRQARDYLAETWIDDQARYHRRRSKDHEHHGRRFEITIFVLFLLAFAVALVHTFSKPESIAERKSAGWIVIQLSIVVPVIGASVHGISTQREFRRHAMRYERMAKLLSDLARDMRMATDSQRIGQLAADAERLIRDENSDWFGVMRFHDVELIT